MSDTIRTVSAGGIVIDDDKVLVINSPSRNAMAFPKGTIDEGETIEMAALREVEEETGYRVQILESLGRVDFEFESKEGLRYDKTVYFFTMELTDHEMPIANLQPGEDFTNLWLTFDEARAQLTYEDQKELLERAIATVRPLSQ